MRKRKGGRKEKRGEGKERMDEEEEKERIGLDGKEKRERGETRKKGKE